MREVNVNDLIKPPNIRKLIQKTVDTYPLEWKVVHEALQNAKDAIQKREEKGHIEIVLDVSTQSVTVADNGCGFPYDLDLLGIGGTDKDQDYDWRINGNQGVGIKAVIFSTSGFKLDSVRDGKRWQAWIEGAHKYLTEADAECILKVTDPVETPDPQGTRVEYSFPGDEVTRFVNGILDTHLGAVHESLARDAKDRLSLALEFYFRSQSYAGDVNRLLRLAGIVPMDITVTVLATGELPASLNGEVSALLQTAGKLEARFPNIHWDFTEAVGLTASGVPKPTVLDGPLPPGGNIGRHTDRYVFVAKMTQEEEFASLLRNPNLRAPVSPDKYSSLFTQLKGLYIVVGARPVLMRYLLGPPRQFIAASGIPSAHVLAGPTRGGEASYVANNIHFVANVDARLNYGKQTIANPRLVGYVSQFFDDAVRATLKNVAAAIVGLQTGTSSADDIEALLEQEKDVLSRDDLPVAAMSFKKVPHDENALIAIFSEILGNGLLKGYHLYTLSQRARYDGRGTMKLASQPNVPVPSTDSDLRNIEFKLRLRDLISDFEDQSKFANDISLAVIWDVDLPSQVVDYQVVDIEHTPDADRAMDGVTKCLHCKREARHIQILVLSEVLARAGDKASPTVVADTE